MSWLEIKPSCYRSFEEPYHQLNKLLGLICDHSVRGVLNLEDLRLTCLKVPVVPDDLVGSFGTKEIAAAEDHPDRELDVWITEAAFSSQRSWRRVHDIFERHELHSINGAVPVMHQAHEVHVRLDLVRAHRWLAPLISILRELLLQSACPQCPKDFLEDASGEIFCELHVGMLSFEPIAVELISFRWLDRRQS